MTDPSGLVPETPDDDELAQLFDAPEYMHYSDARDGDELDLETLRETFEIHVYAYESDVDAGRVTQNELQSLARAIEDAGTRSRIVILPDAVREDMPLPDDVLYEIEFTLATQKGIDVQSLVDEARMHAQDSARLEPPEGGD